MIFKIEGRYWKNETTFPSINDYIHDLGRSRNAGEKLKRKYEYIACDAMRLALRGKKCKGLITLHYRYYEPEIGQTRDHMNIHAFADKVIQDAMQKCGVIKDDSPEYVDGSRMTHEFFYTSGTPRIEVDIEEL